MSTPVQRPSYKRARTFLADADVRPEYASGAMARIDAQHDELGASYLFASLPGLVRELAEECLDIGSWSSLIAARLEYDAAAGVSLPGDTARARALLLSATQRANEADLLIAELRRLIERAA